jgi:L-serine dehydratase
MKFTATLANGKEQPPSTHWWWICSQRGTRECQEEKIEIKHAFPFPTDKAVDVLAYYCTAQNKKISEIVYENAEKTCTKTPTTLLSR